MGLALDDVEVRAPDPLFAQCEREHVRADDHAAGRVDEDGVLLSCAKKAVVDDVTLASPPGAAPTRAQRGRARARGLVRVDSAGGAHVMLHRRESSFEGGVAGRGRVEGVGVVGEADGR